MTKEWKESTERKENLERARYIADRFKAGCYLGDAARYVLENDGFNGDGGDDLEIAREAYMTASAAYAPALEAKDARADRLERALLDLKPQLTALASMRQTAKRHAHRTKIGVDEQAFLVLADDLEAVRVRMKAILDGAL